MAIYRNAPYLTNLLFTDDSLIFCQANKDEVQVVSDTLQLYAKASGQCINLEKSSTYFSSNASVEQKAWVVDKLKVKEVEKFDSYLGLPTLIGRRVKLVEVLHLFFWYTHPSKRRCDFNYRAH